MGRVASAARRGSSPGEEEPRMWKADMVRRIAEALGWTNVAADEVVEAILATIKATLQHGESVSLRRFGTWQVRAKRARVGRNPRTGAVAVIAARRVVRFIAGQPFKQAIEETV